jgi:hypothetical protein
MGFSLGVLELCSAAGERQRAWRKYGLFLADWMGARKSDRLHNAGI